LKDTFPQTPPNIRKKELFLRGLVPAANYLDAEFGFLQALTERKINLIETEENFPVDTEDMVLENPDNMYWIEWCEETEMAGKATFEAFILYPKEEVVKPPTDN
jgi:hypothetical protein